MAVRPVPLRFSDVFNSNNYFKSGDYLSSFGDQRLVGRLTTNGALTYGNETVHGDEIIYGQSETTSEPLVTNISALDDLTDHHLVTKYTANYMTTHLSSEPTVTTLTANNSLQNNQLASKKYVDDKITESASSNLYPTTYYIGKSYIPNSIDYSSNSRFIESGKCYIKFKNLSFRVYSVVIDIDYSILRSPPNLYNTTWYDNTKTSLYYSSKYQVNFFRDDNNTWLTGATQFYLLDGASIHTNFRVDGSTADIKFVEFGIINNSPVVNVSFPLSNIFTNDLETQGWISSYGASLRLSYATPDNILVPTTVSDNGGINAYFSTTL